MQPRAARKLALDIGHQRLRRGLRRRERRRLAEQQRIDRQQPPRLLIGGAAHHHAVDAARDASRACLDARDAAIEHDRQLRMRGLETKHAVVVERRHVAVLARRQALQPGLARMHDQRVDAGRARPRARTPRATASGSWSSMPMRHFTVTGIATAAFIAATQSPTSAGSAIRQAPKRPSCTRSDGQPTLRLISS